MPKFFVAPTQIRENQITIVGNDARHIQTVLRMGLDEELILCDGLGMDYRCSISSLEGDSVQVKIIEKAPCDVEPKTNIVLYQGLPKADKMEWIIQKCTEVGVTRIVPVSTQYAIMKLAQKETKKLERWQKIAEAAAKQSGRGLIPQVGPRALTFLQAIEEARMLSGTVIAYEKESAYGIKEFISSFSGDRIGIFIGPEGGFSPEEIAQAMQAGIRPITLGKRILRTETAGLVTAAIVLHEME